MAGTTKSRLIILAGIALLSGSSLAALAQPASRDTGYGVYRQFCAGCHDNAAWNYMTLPQMREIGEPRLRRSMYDEGEEAIHYYGDRIPEARMELMLSYIGPNADKTLDCGPPGANMSPTPQCPDTGVPIGPPQPANRPIPDR